MNKDVNSVSRRRFLAGTASVITAPMIIKSAWAESKSNSLNFVTWGGSYQAAQVEAVIKPFTEETGITVNIVAAPDLAKVKAQVLTGNVEWDVIDLPGALAATGFKEGFWEELDLSLFDVADMTIKPTSYSVPFVTFAGGITWNPKKFGPGKYPRNFVEYFDPKKYPGRRTFRNRASETLEAALLGDGVAPKDLYPLDVNRAFKALDRIKPSVATWVAATPQTISLVQTGEVDFSYTYANRVQATTEAGGGVPLAFSFSQNLIGKDDFTVLKGAPNKENAMKFIAYAMRPETQARTMKLLVAVGTVSKKAVAMLPQAVRKWMPDAENPDNVILDDVWWADNDAAVSQRFQEWIMS